MNLIIVTITVVMLGALGISIVIYQSGTIKMQLAKQISCICEVYAECLMEGNVLSRWGKCILLTLSWISNLMTGVYIILNRKGYKAGGQYWNWTKRIGGFILLLIIFIGILWGIGYLLMSIDSIHQKKTETKDRSMQLCYLESYFIISLYTMLLHMQGNKIVEYYNIILIFLGISHLINMVIFIKVITPDGMKKSNSQTPTPETETSFGRCIMTAVILIIMNLIEMFTAVCYTAICFPGSYEKAYTLFDLFYYVAVTFFAIGYGDIAPLSFEARLVADRKSVV